jgi:hypothetical protein
MVVIVIIPIAIVVPAVAVFIPPTMALPPALLARLMQLMPRVIRLSAVPAVVFDGLVQSVICLGGTACASFIIIGVRSRCSSESQHSDERGGGHQPAEKLGPLSVKLHVLYPPVVCPDWMGG